MTQRWRMVLVTALIANAIYKLGFCIDPDGGVNPAIDGLFGLVATYSAWRGTCHSRGRFRTIGSLLTLYLAGTTVGYGTDFVLAMTQGQREFPSPADAVWIASLLPYVVALPLLVRQLVARFDLPAVIDLLLFSVSIAVSFAMLIVAPVVASDESASLLLRVASFTYPAADVVALVVAAYLFVQIRVQTTCINLVAMSAALLALADCLLSLGALERHFPAATATITDLIYDTSFVILGVAVLHLPSVAVQLAEEVPAPARNRRHLIALTCIPLLVPLTLLVVSLSGLGSSTIKLHTTIAASVVMFVLTSIRMAMMLRLQERIAGELDRALTTLKMQMDALQQAQKMEAIGRLAAGIAHEVNTPMQYIEQNLEFIQNNLASGTESSSRSLQQIHEAIDDALLGTGKVTEIVSAVKELGHPDSASFTVADIDGVMANALRIASTHIGDLADVVTSYDAGAMFRCSPVSLHQAFLNILVNAADAIRDTGGRGLISISTALDDDQLVVVIADNGAGMTSAVANRIYEPMFTTKDVGAGSGMGMSFVWSSIVEQHGGQIECESSLGAGTRFTLRLPVDVAAGDVVVSAQPIEC